MESLDKVFETTCADGTIPGVVLAAANKNGSLNYIKAFGHQSLEENAPACTEKTIMSLFSATKLITTVAALQLVETGLIKLDDDVTRIVPELGALEVLVEMKDGKGVLERRKWPITLRHLLTHSSGLTYSFMTPKIAEYNKSIGLPPFSPPVRVTESYNCPLAFQPGTSWTYGTGMDWTGLIIARLVGTDLESHFQQKIFGPLGITDITFWPDRKPELAQHRAKLSIRDPSVPDGTGKAILNKGPNMQASVKEEFGGQGLSASVPSYIKILTSLLRDDEVLLKNETTALMFQPQLTEESREALQAVFRSQPASGPCSIGVFPPNVHYDWGLGGLLTMQDVDEGGVDYRKKGTLTWSGMPNFYWFLDRGAGVCGVFGTQLMPAGDKRTKELTARFEKACYGAAS